MDIIKISILILGVFVCLKAEKEYEHEWVAKIDGDQDSASKIAQELGFINKGKVGGLEGYYRFVPSHITPQHNRAKRAAHEITEKLSTHDKILWVEQQVVLSRQKRGVLKIDEFNDPAWENEWYLSDEVYHDLNAIKAWKNGFTGKGVVVSVLDDGLEWNHTDIIDNYDPKASHDFNDDDSDPSPRYDPTNENKHGTRCAGEIAMKPNNGICGVGVAFDAKVGGVRMLDGITTDRIEAESISFNHKYIDIYSASWGPNDDGRTLEGPGVLASEALIKGVTEGRDGKGVIYVWASGNGGRSGDNCDCDGYTSSIYTISIASVTQSQDSPWYGEKCSSNMAATYSSGAKEEKKIISIDLHNKCTDDHTGTSAAAPLAAGIFALVLQANPNLTWRDVQHLIAWTAQYNPVRNVFGWKTNSAGFKVNSRFGFGLLDANALTQAAVNWVNVPPKTICEFSYRNRFLRDIETGKAIQINFDTNGCRGTENEIEFLEHVQVFTTIEYSRRGDLHINMTSPSGLETMLLSERSGDQSKDGFKNWAFMSVHSWGEKPSGTWKIKIMDRSTHKNKGALKNLRIVLHGTKIPDYYARNGPKNYE